MWAYGSPAPLIAFVLALVSGTVLALGRYITATVLAALAMILLAAWQYAESRGDDARHEIS
jgi:hypothetical protein